MMIFDGHASHISSKVIWICVANKIILLCLPPHTTHLLQPLDIGLFAPLSIYYKNNIRDQCKFGYNYSMDKLAFLKSYYKARDKAFTPNNIQKAWKKSGLEPFLPSLVINQLPSLPPLEALVASCQPSSRPTTSGLPAPNFATQTPIHVGDIRQILELQRQGKLEDVHAVLIKICKAAEKAMAQRLILGNHNAELQEAASRKKERNSRKGGNLSKTDARVYDASSLADRALWANEQLEEEVLNKFMKFSLTIFDFKPKPPRGDRVRKQVAKPLTKVVILAYRGGKGGKVIDTTITDIIEITSSRGRKIRPTAKHVSIKKKK
jgi:hypothetical protein